MATRGWVSLRWTHRSFVVGVAEGWCPFGRVAALKSEEPSQQIFDVRGNDGHLSNQPEGVPRGQIATPRPCGVEVDDYVEAGCRARRLPGDDVTGVREIVGSLCPELEPGLFAKQDGAGGNRCGQNCPGVGPCGVEVQAAGRSPQLAQIVGFGLSSFDAKRLTYGRRDLAARRVGDNVQDLGEPATALLGHRRRVAFDRSDGHSWTQGGSKLSTNYPLRPRQMDLRSASRWEGHRHVLSSESDPLVPVLAGLVVDTVWWLDSCGDEEVDPDSVVKIMESVAWVMGNLLDDQQQRLIEVLEKLAEAEEDPARAEQLRSFPFACGLVEDDPNEDDPNADRPVEE